MKSVSIVKWGRCSGVVLILSSPRLGSPAESCKLGRWMGVGSILTGPTIKKQITKKKKGKLCRGVSYVFECRGGEANGVRLITMSPAM